MGCKLVFPSPQNEVYQNIDHIMFALDRAATQAGIPEGHVTFHQLRHCFCSHAQMQGVSPRTVQQWMGHRDLKTTLRYSHVSPVHDCFAALAPNMDALHRAVRDAYAGLFSSDLLSQFAGQLGIAFSLPNTGRLDPALIRASRYSFT